LVILGRIYGMGFDKSNGKQMDEATSRAISPVEQASRLEPTGRSYKRKK